jgi:hypothetical protein
MIGALHLETVSIFGLLGVRFWDAATGRAIGEGLQVTAAPVGQPEFGVQGAANRSAVYAFHRLPGLSTTPFEKPDGTRAYTIDVRDDFGRFLPFRFTAHAAGGLMTRLESIVGSPLDPSPGITLFSEPARPVTSGMAVVLSELHDSTSPAPDEAPASFARLMVTIPGIDGAPDVTASGVADEQGRVAVIFEHPAPAEVPLGSPLGSPLAGSAIPLAVQSWPVSLSATYAPADPAPPMDLDTTLADLPNAELSFAGGSFAASLPFTLVRGLGLAKEVVDISKHWVPITPVLSVRPSVSPP